MKRTILYGLVIGAFTISKHSFSQFAPAAGQPGTTAMYKDSSAFIGWATKCHITRGLQDISVSSGGYATIGDSSSAYGVAGTTGIVSLGDGGTAVLQFVSPIKDASGPDFAVFENSFNDTFLELAFVEVSSDGLNYFRFPAVSNTDTLTQTGSFDPTDPAKIHNLAGKYRAQYGTPFDLADLAENALLDKQAITHVKIIDVVGCIQNQYCTRDVNHRKVNDPWPTAFGSGGFDLDAVGVIHQQLSSTGVNELEALIVYAFPNPATDVISVSIGSGKGYSVSVINLLGEQMLCEEHTSGTCMIRLNELSSGIYVLNITAEGKQKQLKFVKS